MKFFRKENSKWLFIKNWVEKVNTLSQGEQGAFTAGQPEALSALWHTHPTNRPPLPGLITKWASQGCFGYGQQSLSLE